MVAQAVDGALVFSSPLQFAHSAAETVELAAAVTSAVAAPAGPGV